MNTDKAHLLVFQIPLQRVPNRKNSLSQIMTIEDLQEVSETFSQSWARVRQTATDHDVEVVYSWITQEYNLKRELLKLVTSKSI